MRRNVDLRIVNYIKAPDAIEPQLVGRVDNFASLDLFENEEIRITFQNQDINDYSKQKISYTKTFNIPATPNNNKLLNFEGMLNNTIGQAGSTSGSTDYIVNLFNYPIAVQLWIDDLFIFDGTLLLLSVNKVENNNSYECIFTTNIYSIIPLLKEQPFNDAYFAKGLNNYLNNLQKPIIPANFIWDSIIFENFDLTGSTISSRKQLLPSVSSYSANTGIYPIYNQRTLSGLTNHIIDSWGGNAKTNKFYWGYIDDGKINYNPEDPNKPDRVNLNDTFFLNPTPYNEIDNIGLLTTKALNYDSFEYPFNCFNLFETIKPYYYVGDVFRKILRWLERRLNGEYFDYLFFNPLEEYNKQPLNFTNYNNPDEIYKNIPIKFEFDSDILSRFDSSTPKALDTMVLFTPENTEYSNNKLNYYINCVPKSGFFYDYVRVTSGSTSFIKLPITNYNAGDLPTGIQFNWDQYGIGLFETKFRISIIDNPGEDQDIIYSYGLTFNNYPVIITTGTTDTIEFTNPFYKDYSFKGWCGIGPYSGLPSHIISNLPSGYTSSNYFNLRTTFTYPDPTSPSINIVDERAIENWKYNLCIFENYILNTQRIGDTQASQAYNKDVNTSYDLRRYLYPTMSDISMGDFIQDIFKLLNIKYEEPNFQSTIENIQFKTENNYYKDIFNKNGIVDITDKVDIDKIKVKQLLFDDVIFKYGPQGCTLTDFYKNNNQYNLEYGENKFIFDTFRKVNKSLKIETKLSQPVMKQVIISNNNKNYDQNNLNSLGWICNPSYEPIYIPSLYNFDEFTSGTLNFNTDINIKPIDTFKPFVLFNYNGDYNSSVRGDYDLDRKNNFNNFEINISLRSFNKQFQSLIVKYDDISGTTFGRFPVLQNEYENNTFTLLADDRLSTHIKRFRIIREGKNFQPQYEDTFKDINTNRLIELEIDFKLTDIINFTFGQIYSLRLNGEYNLYVVNKINDYVLNNTKLAKVELLQLNNPSKYLRTPTIV